MDRGGEVGGGEEERLLEWGQEGKGEFLMLKVAVVDSGWGGEMVADYIEYELAVIEVIRVIDWRNAPYAGKTRMEILRCIEQALRPYWRRVDAVVLGGFVPSLVVDALRTRHPAMKFVALELKNSKIVGKSVKKVMILADEWTRGLSEYEDLRWQAWLKAAEVVEPNCKGWTEMIDEGEMNYEFLERALKPYLGDGRMDALIIANTHYWDIRKDLLRILRWRARVVDQREALLHDLCRALRLRGVDGRRRR